MKTKIVETRPKEPRHFARIPRMINETKMSVYAYRLYGHIKQLVGDSGHCWQTLKTLTKKCNMSMTSVIKARNELESLGFITVSRIPREVKGGYYFVVTPVWLWEENNERYDKNS